MKNISILIYSLAGGGAERVVSILLNELKEKYNIKLVLMNDTIFYDIPQDIEITYLEKSNPNERGINKLFKLPILGYKYYKFCKRNNIDISLSFMNRSNYINVFSKIFGSKSKIVLSERAMPSLQHKDGMQGKINKFLIKHLYKKADIITANSLGNTKDLEENFYINVVKTINNIVDVDMIENKKKENVGFQTDKFSFITIGRLDSGKNHKLLIEAIKDIDARLYIIGDGELKDQLNQFIKELNLEKKVILLGRKDNPYKYITKADCFVFGSSYEGFPNVLLEALVCELPIISTDCKSGPREILSNNSNMDISISDVQLTDFGILVPIEDPLLMKKAMIEVKDDSTLRKKYKKSSIKRAKDFSKEKIITQWIDLLDN